MLCDVWGDQKEMLFQIRGNLGVCGRRKREWGSPRLFMEGWILHVSPMAALESWIVVPWVSAPMNKEGLQPVDGDRSLRRPQILSALHGHVYRAARWDMVRNIDYCSLSWPIYFSRIILLFLMEVMAGFSSSTNCQIILSPLFVCLLVLSATV